MTINVTNNNYVEAINLINTEIEKCGYRSMFIQRSIIPDIKRNPPVFPIDYYAECLAKGQNKNDIAVAIHKKLTR